MVLRGDACVTSFAVRVVIAIVDSSLILGVCVPVTTTPCISSGSALSAKFILARSPVVTVIGFESGR